MFLTLDPTLTQPWIQQCFKFLFRYCIFVFCYIAFNCFHYSMIYVCSNSSISLRLFKYIPAFLVLLCLFQWRINLLKQTDRYLLYRQAQNTTRWPKITLTNPGLNIDPLHLIYPQHPLFHPSFHRLICSSFQWHTHLIHYPFMTT